MQGSAAGRPEQTAAERGDYGKHGEAVTGVCRRRGPTEGWPQQTAGRAPGGNPRSGGPGVTPRVKSDVEAEGAELLPAVLGDLVGTPRRHPDPVDPEVADEPVQR